MKTKRRIIIIGLDGVPFGMLNELSSNGTMPNVGRLLSAGIFRKMESSIPEISSVAWSSVLTGSNPAEHGIFGFMDFAPDSYRIYFPNFDNLQKSPFWTNIKGESVIINVPSTYPVRKIRGVHISGFVSVDFERSVYPKELMDMLKKMDYRLDVDSEKAHQSFDLFFADLDRTLKARIEAQCYLWKHLKWKVFMLVFTGTDRLMHFLWDAYTDKTHKYHRRFLDYFNEVDAAIGEILNSANDTDEFIMLSDHGFGPLDKDVYVNHFLCRAGFLKFQNVLNPKWSHVDSSAKALALDPARIYVNLKGKYPNGSINNNEIDKVLKELEDAFNSLEIDNKKVIKKIYRKEEIYHGPLFDRAPDLILVGNDGFNLKASLRLDALHDRDIFTGKHTQDDAFLLVRSSIQENIVPMNPKVSDVKGIIDKLTKV
jgi:predicted AlkP superfamily phosphohydrolase/phosphomutase